MLYKSVPGVLVLLSCLSVVADDAKESKPEKISLTGVFEAVQSSELKFGTEQLSTLKLDRIVPHGTLVKKGQTIATVETEDIDRQIRTAEEDLQIARVTRDDADFDYEQFKVTQQLDRAVAERTFRSARQAFDNFVQIDKDRNVETALHNLKGTRAALENAMEELKQLQQMYEEDDLTEESEEIVLKRARQAVESAQFRMKGAEIQADRSLKQTLPLQHVFLLNMLQGQRLIQADRSLKQTLPLQHVQQKDVLQRAEMAHAKSIRTLNSARQKKEIEVSRVRESFARQEQKLAELRNERRQLVLTAPHDGILLHGTLTRGKLSDKPVAHRKGASVTGSQVVATVVNPTQLQLRVDLNEQQHSTLTQGMSGTVQATAFVGKALNVVVRSVASVPFANGKFDCVISVKGKNTVIVPGTSGSVSLSPQK